MAKVKIIHILSHMPPSWHVSGMTPTRYFTSNELGTFHKLEYPPHWVGFFAQDHHTLAALDLLNLTDEFEIECWRPYGYGLKESHVAEINGIKHRVFPAYRIDISHFGSVTWSEELYDAILNEIVNNKIILNISVGHAWFHIKLMLKLKKYKNTFGLVAVHRSGGFRRFAFKQLAPWKKLFKWYYLIESFVDKKSLEASDIYYVGAQPETDYLHNSASKINAQFLMEGLDFSKYCVLTKDEKRRLREKLGLPLHKKILIASGNWLSTDYGYQHLLEVYREIKSSPDGDELQLVLIGGYKTQDLYEIGICSGAIMIERVEKAQFIKYLEASDFFAQASFSWSFIEFGGFGVAMIEALACGLPVISGNIIHFPGTKEELLEIGLNMPDKKVLKENIVFMMNNLHKYKNCRLLAQKYYDINITRPVLLNKYRELAYKYYGVDTSKQQTKK